MGDAREVLAKFITTQGTKFGTHLHQGKCEVTSAVIPGLGLNPVYVISQRLH